MFFNHEKYTIENFYIPKINVLERKLLAPSSHWDPPTYTRKKGPMFLSVT